MIQERAFRINSEKCIHNVTYTEIIILVLTLHKVILPSYLVSFVVFLYV